MIVVLTSGCTAFKMQPKVQYDDHDIVVAITQVDLNSTRRDLDLWKRLGEENVQLENRIAILQGQVDSMRAPK